MIDRCDITIRSALAALCCCAAARAELTGVIIETVDLDAPSATTYRAYGEFDETTDQLVAIRGRPDVRALLVSTDTDLLNGGGTFGGLPPEDHPLPFGFAGAEWDSWMTIGSEASFPSPTDHDCPIFDRDLCNLSIFHGAHLVDDTGGWFDRDPSTPVTPDERGRILIAQLTVIDHPDGTSGAVRIEGTAEWFDAQGTLRATPFAAATSPCPPRSDFNGNGFTDFGDLISMLASYGACDDCPQDLTGDGVVGHTDLREFWVHWNACD